MDKKIVYIDMDGVIVDFAARKNEVQARHPKIKYPQAHYGFFANLDIMEEGNEIDAFAAVNMLQESEEYDPWIATAPSVKNPLCYTEKRVSIERFFGMQMAKKLIIIPDKSKLIGDYLIDDNAEGKAKQHLFTGELIHYGNEEYPNWYSIMKYLGLV